MKTIFFLIIITLIIFCIPAWPHPQVGRRIFPATIAVLDPAVNDKANLSIFRKQASAEKGGSIWTTNPRFVYGKRITKSFQLAINASYLHIHSPNERVKNGFDDWIIGAQYEVYLNPHYESIFSLALNAAIGGTGSHLVNADSSTTLSPLFLFGQGLGPLPESFNYLKPFVITGLIGANLKTKNFRVASVDWGLVIEYSLPYLQAYIVNLGMPMIMEHLVPLIEFPMNTCTQGKCSRKTIGTFNPGFLYVGKYTQLGLEALIPVNSHTGSKVGAVLQLHFYLDDIFPNSIGKPIFACG